MDPGKELFIFQKFVESSILGHCFADLQGNILYANPALCVMLGYEKPQDILGKNIYHFYPRDARTQLQNDVLPKVKQKGAWRGELFLISAQGHLVPTIQDISFIKDENGKLMYFGNIIADITERKKTEEILRLTKFSIDNSSINVYWTNAEGRFIYVNEHALKTLGYTREEMLSMSIWDIDPVVTKEFWAGNWKKFKQEKIANIETAQVRKDGSRFPAEVQANYVEHAGKEYSFAFVRDVTDSKQAKREMEREKELAEKYLNIVKVMIVGLNSKKEVVLINERGCEILGYHRTEIIGRNWFESFIPSRMRKEVHRVADELFKGHIDPVEYYENPVVTKSGEERTIAWHNIILRDDQGKIVTLLSAGEDITERKKTEKRIIEERDFSDAVLNSLPSVFYMFDQDGKFLRWNKNFEKISGYSAGEIEQMNPIDFFVDEDKKLIKQKIQEAFKKGASDVEAKVVTKTGRTIIFYFSSQAVQIGAKMCLVGTGVDISERKQVEDDLRQAGKEKEMLLREVHHRVKNNLLTLYSLVNLQKMSLRDGLSAERALEDTKQRISAIGRVHRMLYLSKDFAEIDFLQYIRALVDEIRIANTTSDCKISIGLDLCPAVLNIDTAISCGLIINELLVNSFRHAFAGRKKGRITVSLANKGKYFELQIGDDGVGISYNPLAGESKTLGMKLVVMLAKQIKAKVFYKSDQGSLFTIVFKNVTIGPPR